MAPVLPPCRCSGDDGINICEQAEPLFRRCTLTVRKCGAKLFGSGRGRFEDCIFEKCGEQAVKAMESSAVTLARQVLGVYSSQKFIRSTEPSGKSCSTLRRMRTWPCLCMLLLAPSLCKGGKPEANASRSLQSKPDAVHAMV